MFAGPCLCRGLFWTGGGRVCWISGSTPSVECEVLGDNCLSLAMEFNGMTGRVSPRPGTLTESNLSAHNSQATDASSKSEGVHIDDTFNVFEQHGAKIQELEKLNEKHRRRSDYSVQDTGQSKQIIEKATNVSKDHRELSLIQTSERMFNEEKKMFAHGGNFHEWSKWMLRKSVVHMSKSFLSCIAVINSETEVSHAQHRMVKMLSHLEELAELLLLCFLIRDRPDEMKACGIGSHHNNLRNKAMAITKKFDLIHRICTMQNGQTRTRKLHVHSKIFNKLIVHFKRDFNAWDEQQSIRMLNLMRYVQQVGALPFKVAPSAGLIRVVKEERRLSNTMSQNNAPEDGGEDVNGGGSSLEADNIADAESKSTWTGTRTESTDSESSWESIQRREIKRAFHPNRFTAGGKVIRYPRAPRTRGGRPYTNMELGAIPLVTGAREAPEAGTFMDSPKKAPHPSWEPHVKMEVHKTHGTAYHSHGYGVKHPKHHKDHGHAADQEYALHQVNKGGKEGEHHHHHHHKHHEERDIPMSLKECIQNHVMDPVALKNAYLMRKVKVPESWKHKKAEIKHTAEGILKRAQAIHVHEHKAHNVYTVEEHHAQRPPNGRDRKQAILKLARERSENHPMNELDTMAYRHKFVTNVAVERAQTARSVCRTTKAKDNIEHREIVCTTALGQTEIQKRMLRPSTASAEFQGPSKRLTTDIRPGYKFVYEMKHKKVSESASHRGKSTEKGHFQTITLSPRRPEPKRPSTARDSRLGKGRTIVGTVLRNEKSKFCARERPSTATGLATVNKKQASPSSPLSSAKGSSPRAQSVAGRYTSLTVDGMIKHARPVSAIAQRQLMSATGNHEELKSAIRPEIKTSGMVSLSTSSSAYFHEMHEFEVKLEKKEREDAIHERIKSWRTKTKAAQRRAANAERARQLYKKGGTSNVEGAKKAESLNRKADHLRKLVPFSF